MYCFASICRICLTSNKTDLINLNKSDTDNIKITDKLTFCIPEIFNPYNNLPEKICGDCCQFIHRMYEFKQLCIDNTIILNKYASKLSSVPGTFEKNDLTIKITKDPKIEELLESSSIVITDDESDSSVEFIEDQYELELDVIPNLEEQTTSCQLEEQTTSDQLEVETSPKLKIQTSPKLKIQTSPQLKLQTSPQLEIQTSPQLEIQTSPQLVIQTSPQLEIQTSPQLEIQTSPKLDLQLTSPLETPSSPQLETLLSPKLETLLSPKLETPSSPQLEIPSRPQLETQSSPHSEENPQLEIKTSPQSEKQTSPQPVTLNNSPCSSNQPNSLSAPPTSNEISMYSVSLNKWDLFETKYTCRCIKEFSSFTENTTHLCKNCEGELLGFRLSKIKVGAAENRYSTNFPTIKQEEVENSDSFESDESDFENNEPNEYVCERGFDYNDVLLCKVHINGVKKQINNLEDNLNHSEPNSKLNTGKYKVKQNTCPICAKTFPTRHFLNNHYLLHSGTKLLECDHCDEKYVDKSYLENHKLNHYRITKQKNNPSIQFEFDTPTTSKSVTFSDSDSEEEDHNVSKSSKNSDLNSSGEIAACGTCDKIFDSKSKLAIHLMTHFGKKDYKCPTCHKEFFRKENFDIHMNTHHIMPPPPPPVTQSITLKYRCPHCLRIYNNISNVRRHIRETHEIKTYCCLICDEVFNDKEILQQHALVEHTADDGVPRKKFMCPNCDKNFPTMSYVRRHMGEVHGLQRFVCLICDAVFSNKQILDDHVFDEHTVSLNEFNEEIHKPKKSKSIDIKKFQCPHCEKCYNHKSNVQRHVKEKHETVKVENMVTSDDDDADDEQHQYEEEHQYEEDPEYEEEEPEYEEDAELEDPDYNEDSDYKEEPEFDEYEEDEDDEEEEDEYKTKDYEMKLNDNKQYTCHYCERPFQNVRSLRQHVRDGHGKVEYFCTICNAIFNEKQTLDEHIFVVHNMMNSDDDTEQETKPHSQEIKPHAQDRKSSHAQERKSSHTQERKSQTQETKPFHIEAKKFECSLCDKRYFHLSAVRRHMRDSHSVVNVDKYLCSICNKTFVDKRILEEHIFSVHTQTENKNTTTDEDKQKGFSCPVCHKRFLHLSNLRMHALSHTDVQEPSSYNYCKICKKAIKKNTSMTRHMRTHKRAKMYDCTVCTDKFDNRWVFTQHMKTKHPDFKSNFECKVCSKTYTTKYTFLKHRQTHTQ